MENSIQSIKENRRKHKIIAIKNGLANVGDDVKLIADNAGQKIFFTSLIGVGALCLAAGIATKDPANITVATVAAGTIGTLSVCKLKDLNDYITVKEQMTMLANDIKETYSRVSIIDAQFSEEKGRQL